MEISADKNYSEKIFSRYEVFIIAILATLQFTVVMDFMVLSPLGAILIGKLNLSTSNFGLVVSAYAFSAGLSGMLTAGFADRFDRKKLLLFFYVGFITGTLLCAIAPGYYGLLVARVVTGMFGGVIASISYAIITDLFKLEVRGRVMGYVQMAFSASRILGIPVGLWLANEYGWHSPFWVIVSLGSVVGIVILIYMKPINEHLQVKAERNAFQHLKNTLSQAPYKKAFVTTALLTTGGFMLMPFASAFTTENLGISLDALPLLYGITGVFTMLSGPYIGKLSDQIGKYKVFVIGTLVGIPIILIYTNLGITPFWICTGLNVILFLGITSRMISAQALMTAVPNTQFRGSFMSINASIQQVSGGIAAAISGLIVIQTPAGKLQHYNTLGVIVIGTMLITIYLLYNIHRYVMKKEWEE